MDPQNNAEKTESPDLVTQYEIWYRATDGGSWCREEFEGKTKVNFGTFDEAITRGRELLRKAVFAGARMDFQIRKVTTENLGFVSLVY